jgi:hypothetical protein
MKTPGGDARYTGAEFDAGKVCPMRRCLFVLIALFGLAMGASAEALESGTTCDIADDAVHPDLLIELERILKELAAAAAATS